MLAAAVAFLPGGGTTASSSAVILSTLIIVAFVLLAARFYREHRVELESLGDRWRALLYGGDRRRVVLALAGACRGCRTPAAARSLCDRSSLARRARTRSTSSGATTASTALICRSPRAQSRDSSRA